jgi:hypothetical protein
MIGKLRYISAFAKECEDGVCEGDQESTDMFGGKDSGLGLVSKRIGKIVYRCTITILVVPHGLHVFPYCCRNRHLGTWFFGSVCSEHLHK